MAEIGIRALKQNASAVVARAASGEQVTITDRGRPVAQLTPLSRSRLQALVEAGRARVGRHQLRQLPPPPAGPNLSQELEAMRAAERF